MQTWEWHQCPLWTLGKKEEKHINLLKYYFIHLGTVLESIFLEKKIWKQTT